MFDTFELSSYNSQERIRGFKIDSHTKCLTHFMKQHASPQHVFACFKTPYILMLVSLTEILFKIQIMILKVLIFCSKQYLNLRQVDCFFTFVCMYNSVFCLFATGFNSNKRSYWMSSYSSRGGRNVWKPFNWKFRSRTRLRHYKRNRNHMCVIGYGNRWTLSSTKRCRQKHSVICVAKGKDAVVL